MPEYLQNLDDGSVLLFRLCLENANIISEVRNIWSNEYFLNYYPNADNLEYITKQPRWCDSETNLAQYLIHMFTSEK